MPALALKGMTAPRTSLGVVLGKRVLPKHYFDLDYYTESLLARSNFFFSEPDTSQAFGAHMAYGPTSGGPHFWEPLRYFGVVTPLPTSQENATSVLVIYPLYESLQGADSLPYGAECSYGSVELWQFARDPLALSLCSTNVGTPGFLIGPSPEPQLVAEPSFDAIDDLPEEARDILRELEDLTGWSRRRLAALVDTSHSTLNRILNDVNQPRENLRTHLTETLRVVRRVALLADHDSARCQSALTLVDHESGLNAAMLLTRSDYAAALGTAMRALRPRTRQLAPVPPLRYYDEPSVAIRGD